MFLVCAKVRIYSYPTKYKAKKVSKDNRFIIFTTRKKTVNCATSCILTLMSYGTITWVTRTSLHTA